MQVCLSGEAEFKATSHGRSRESRKGISEIEGKVARVVTSELGNERVSNQRYLWTIAEGGKGPYPDME
jgi:hypothetical protein